MLLASVDLEPVILYSNTVAYGGGHPDNSSSDFEKYFKHKNKRPDVCLSGEGLVRYKLLASIFSIEVWEKLNKTKQNKTKQNKQTKKPHSCISIGVLGFLTVKSAV